MRFIARFEALLVGKEGPRRRRGGRLGSVAWKFAVIRGADFRAYPIRAPKCVGWMMSNQERATEASQLQFAFTTISSNSRYCGYASRANMKVFTQ